MAIVKDPICGMSVETATSRWTAERGGQTFHFCSRHCRDTFAARAGGAGSLPVVGAPMGPSAGYEAMAVQQGGTSGWQAYTPLIVAIAMILAAILAASAADLRAGAWPWRSLVSRFMAGFFLVFAGFKLMDLRGFADGYATYDLLARRAPAYAFLYPFVELAFGLSMLANYSPAWLLWTEAAVMGFSGLGVALKLAKGEKFQCACLGTFLKVPLTKVTLVEDFGMMALALALLLAARFG